MLYDGEPFELWRANGPGGFAVNAKPLMVTSAVRRRGMTHFLVAIEKVSGLVNLKWTRRVELSERPRHEIDVEGPVHGSH